MKRSDANKNDKASRAAKAQLVTTNQDDEQTRTTQNELSRY